ncbi:hypothetical protein ONZ45_g17747 [Pleurotus djamor]|nr:hypothetical protein ONZ45_g17747 [Pleurotus djamor]
MADSTSKETTKTTKEATRSPDPTKENENAAAESSKEAEESTSESTSPAEAQPEASSSSATPQTAWQAIYSPSHGAYYFYNTETQETTWTNPLQEQEASTSTSASQEPETEPSASETPEPSGGPAPTYTAAQQAAIAAGIDPSLAYLDPSLAYAGIPGGSAAPNGQPSFTAKFNARTGAFSANNSRDPTHLSEYERAKRMSEFYFDVGQWEKDVATRQEEEAQEGGKKRKRLTKKDLDRFKEQKRLKKIAKTAWLRQ